jgi:hypothetical protein
MTMLALIEDIGSCAEILARLALDPPTSQLAIPLTTLEFFLEKVGQPDTASKETSSVSIDHRPRFREGDDVLYLGLQVRTEEVVLS